MSTKHTPGPWRVETEKGRVKFDENTGEPLGPMNYHYVRGAEGSLVLLVSRDERHPDAELISAAPELLVALEGAIVALRLGQHVDQRAAIEYGLEVLAKATGGAK